MKQKFIDAYMKVASVFADLSHAKRLHVGAIVVKDDRIISIGYNGMPSGWDNCCEDMVECDLQEAETIEGSEDSVTGFKLKTKPEVLHAESNAIAKLAKSNESGDGADIFITHSPCIECAKLIYQSGIRRVFYGDNYRDDAGIRFLKASGVEVHKQGE
jgi:dCMP deaminase